MDRISSPRDLHKELHQLLGDCQKQKPSRKALAAQLMSLANRVAGNYDPEVQSLVRAVDDISATKRVLPRAKRLLGRLLERTAQDPELSEDGKYGATQVVGSMLEAFEKLETAVEGVEEQYDDLNRWFLKWARNR